jgi:hypothetical protein
MDWPVVGVGRYRGVAWSGVRRGSFHKRLAATTLVVRVLFPKRVLVRYTQLTVKPLLMRITFQDMIGGYRKRKAFGHHVKYFFLFFYFQIILSMKKKRIKCWGSV